MANQPTNTGLTHLGKTALPLIGRIGTIAGGIVSLLAIFETISGEIMTTIAALILVAAFVASTIVVFHQTTSRWRLNAHGLWLPSARPDYRRHPDDPCQFLPARLCDSVQRQSDETAPTQQLERVRAGDATSTRHVDSRPSPQTWSAAADHSHDPPSATPTLTWMPTPPTRTLTVTPFPIEQMTDVSILIKSGNNAQAAKNYALAVSYFARALQIDATNAPAQLGLGKAHFFMNDVNAAYDPLRTALQLNPTLYKAHAYLGFVYDYRSDFVRAPSTKNFCASRRASTTCATMSPND